jgi:hypothetical protein
VALMSAKGGLAVGTFGSGLTGLPSEYIQGGHHPGALEGRRSAAS